jgi:hypothetical protein
MFFLEEIYKKFLCYEKKRFLEDSDNWLGVEKTNQKKKIWFFDNYYKVSFHRFLSNVKTLTYNQNPFLFVEKGWGDNWELELYLDFLQKEKLISLKKDRIKVENKDFFNPIPLARKEDEIKQKILKKTKFSVNDKEPINLFIEKFHKFKVKGEWDQMPLSQASVVFSASKILEYLPLKKKFLFIGDDDFVSVFLSLADPEIESVVVDADQELLDCIEKIALKFKLKIETRLVDTRKEKDLKENFVGFSCNPPYTEKGVKSFLDYGLNQLNQKGGNVFLAMGTENIGNRILFLQEYFSRKNLAVMEAITGKLNYPYLSLFKEDKDNLRRMKKHLSFDLIKKSFRLGADLWVFDYVPFKVEKRDNNNSIYSYL